MPRTPRLPLGIDTSKPNPARIYDAMLGGKDNFEVDRAFCEQVLQLFPGAAEIARSNRRWLVEAVHWLAAEIGIEQFLDLGSGLPTVQNTHEVAQAVKPDATVVYVDHDPTVIAHGRALLHDDARTFFCAGDLTDPAGVLAQPQVAENIDFGRPVAALQCLTLHHVAETKVVQEIMTGYMERLASGSYVALTHIQQIDAAAAEARQIHQTLVKYREAIPDLTARTRSEIAELLAGLDLVEPGVAPTSMWWHNEPSHRPVSYDANLFVGAIGRKP